MDGHALTAEERGCAGSGPELTVDRFRLQAQAELHAHNEHLAKWHEWLLRQPHAQDDLRPWTLKGREFFGFYETFCRILQFYKPEKIGVFRPMGWALDEAVIGVVSAQLRRLIEHARATEPNGPFEEWLRSYDPEPMARYTAIDRKFQTLTGASIRRVLDFGSGIGRQAFHWCGAGAGTTLYSVDAIENFYLLQHHVYRHLFPERLVEYFCDPEAFPRAIAAAQPGQLYHLPTWRLSCIPDQSVDLIICVQVLQEINGSALLEVLRQFRRIARPGGLLYIRDKEFWTPVHAIRVGRVLLQQGWELVFKYTGSEGTDIEGVPRLWAITGADPRRYLRAKARLKRMFLPSYHLSFHSWKDWGLPI